MDKCVKLVQLVCGYRSYKICLYADGDIFIVWRWNGKLMGTRVIKNKTLADFNRRVENKKRIGYIEDNEQETEKDKQEEAGYKEDFSETGD